ncbi:MAG: hypothetical protein ACI8UD_002579 [Planctomycetota bacterium]|jgi:hypothetical protein
MLKTTVAVIVATTMMGALPAQNCFSTMVGTDLLLNDDDTAQGLSLGFTFNFGGVAYTDICVSSNGFIWFGPTSVAGSDFSPTEAELLGGAARICPLWCDFNPAAAGSGHIYFNTSGGTATITWAGVHEYGGTNAVEMQVVLDAASNITVTYGVNSAVGGTLNLDAIIGASTGLGATANPVSLATRPITVTSDTFYEVIPVASGTLPIAYPNVQMVWAATNPGYTIADASCTMNSLPAPGYSEIVGAGCPARQGPALYETFTATGNVPDLSGLDLTFLPASGTEYVVIPGVSTTYFTGYANALTLGDDQTVMITLPFAFPYNGGVINEIYVSSNGFLTFGPIDPGSGCCTGTAGTLLGGEPRIAAWWADLNPNSGGNIYADLDPVGGGFVISWDQVPEYNTGPPQTAQIELGAAGDFTIRWGTVTTATHTFLTGYSGGNGTPDPGASDLSAVNGALVSTTIVAPLEHAASAGSSPQVGGSFSVDASNVPASPNGNVCLLLVSTELPGGVPLDIIGMTGCTAYVNLPQIYSAVNVTVGAPTTTFSVPLPNAAVLFGGQLMSQVISDDLVNSFGFIASNGLRWTLGL